MRSSTKTAMIMLGLVSVLAGSSIALLHSSRSASVDCTGVALEQEVGCFSSLVIQAYEDEGLEAASDVMLAGSTGIGIAPDRFAARCHDIAHALGKAIDIGLEANLESRGPSICRSGFFHGVHFQRFARYETPADLVAAAPYVCVGSELQVRVGRGGVGNGCRHALGHELHLRGLGHVEGAQTCEVPPIATHNPESAVSDCLYGLYMELFLGYEATASYTNPLPVCLDPSISVLAALACAGEAGLSLFRMAERSTPSAAFDVCEEFSRSLDTTIGRSCAGGLGRSASAFLENDRSRTIEFCSASEELYESCLVDAAAAMMEAEQDYSWATICAGLSIEEYCRTKMQDITSLVETRR